MMNAQSLLREEMKEKELHKRMAEEHLTALLDTEAKQKTLHNEHANQQAYLRQQVTLLEDKNLRVLKESCALEATIADRDKQITAGELLLTNKEGELDELRVELRDLKSAMIDKDEQIENMMQTLAHKGEEAGILAEKLIDLKNHMLD